jgi:hypothetical protein
MTTPFALELMHYIMQTFDYSIVSIVGVEYIEVYVPKKSLLSREEALLFIKYHNFLSAYKDFLIIGEMEKDHIDYVLISIDKNAKRNSL